MLRRIEVLSFPILIAVSLCLIVFLIREYKMFSKIQSGDNIRIEDTVYQCKQTQKLDMSAR